jgi:ribosomal protein L37AE/L43A
MTQLALTRRYGRAARRKVEPIQHQCPGCGDPVTVKRLKGRIEDEERMCPRCQRIARDVAKKAAHERAEQRRASAPTREAIVDVLGFTIGHGVIALDPGGQSGTTTVGSETWRVVRGPEGWTKT